MGTAIQTEAGIGSRALTEDESSGNRETNDIVPRGLKYQTFIVSRLHP